MTRPARPVATRPRGPRRRARAVLGDVTPPLRHHGRQVDERRGRRDPVELVRGEVIRPPAMSPICKAGAGVEMAVIAAVANSIRIPLWRLFGGASNTVTTDITIPIVTPNEAAQLAAKYRGQGFQTLKLKVRKNLNSDIEVLKAIRLVHPDCSFILDANEGTQQTMQLKFLTD